MSHRTIGRFLPKPELRRLLYWVRQVCSLLFPGPRNEGGPQTHDIVAAPKDDEQVCGPVGRNTFAAEITVRGAARSELLSSVPQLLVVHFCVGPLEHLGYSFSGPPCGDAYCRTHADSLLRLARRDHELIGKTVGDS